MNQRTETISQSEKEAHLNKITILIGAVKFVTHVRIIQQKLKSTLESKIGILDQMQLEVSQLVFNPYSRKCQFEPAATKFREIKSEISKLILHSALDHVIKDTFDRL